MGKDGAGKTVVSQVTNSPAKRCSALIGLLVFLDAAIVVDSGLISIKHCQ